MGVFIEKHVSSDEMRGHIRFADDGIIAKRIAWIKYAREMAISGKKPLVDVKDFESGCTVEQQGDGFLVKYVDED